MNAAPHWLEVVVIEGLQMLLTLRLRNAPAHDTITAVLDVWLAAIMYRNPVWFEDRDASRFRSAFLRLAATLDTWPSPAQLYRELPKLPEQRALDAPEPPIPRGEKIHRKIATLIDKVTEGKGLFTPPPPPKREEKDKENALKNQS